MAGQLPQMLDAAAAEAYSWNDYKAEMADEEILRRLSSAPKSCCNYFDSTFSPDRYPGIRTINLNLHFPKIFHAPLRKHRGVFMQRLQRLLFRKRL